MLLEKDIDKKLYREFLAGNKEALGKLIYKYRNSLIYFIFKYVRNQETAEDIFQDVMVYLLDKKEVYNFDYSFKTFLYIVAKSRALNYIKNKKIEDELTDNEKNLFVEEELLEEIILSKERQTNIRNVISKMNHEYQMVIFLGVIEELSYNEIAKIMNKSTSQIKNLLHRARIKLRKLLIQERIVEMKNNRAIRFLMWFIVLGLITSGVVYATSYCINYIWKEPEKYNLEEESKVTEEDEEKAISEEEIDTIISEKLSWLGYDEAQISDKHLVKFPEYKKMDWMITLKNNTSFTLNAITGELIQFSDDGFNDLEIKSTANENEAKKIARELYTKLGYKDGEYDIATLNKSGTGTDEALWRADFCKKYGDVFNKYQCIRISFVPEVEKIKILTIFDEDYEDNPVVITQDEAIEIAKKKYLALGKDETKIKSITVKMDIEKMNTVWHNLTNNSNNTEDENTNKTITVNTNEQEMYRTPETIIRKVWTVKIDYSDDFAHIDSFYVDVTTGEIIGGGTAK